MLSIYSIDKCINFINEYRQFEQYSLNYGVLKIQMIFNHDDDLAEILIKKWKQMDNNFTRFFLHLNTDNQKMMLDYFQIPVARKRAKIESEYSTNPILPYDSLILPDELMLINCLLFYFNNRALNKNIIDLQLPHIPENPAKLIASGSNWADYILDLSYEEQKVVLLKILQN